MLAHSSPVFPNLSRKSKLIPGYGIFSHFWRRLLTKIFHITLSRLELGYWTDRLCLDLW